MKQQIMFGLIVILFTAIFCTSTVAGTSIKINSASVDVSSETLLLNGINFNAYGPVFVTIGDALLETCTINETTIECSLSDTPPILSEETTWNVSISAGNAPHTNDDIDVFVLTEQIAQNCPVGVSFECYSGEPATRDVGSCQSGFSTCLSDGAWSACDGQTLPVAETCDDFSDNDCDGNADCDDDDCVNALNCFLCDPLIQNCSDETEACFVNVGQGSSLCGPPASEVGNETPGQQDDTCTFLNTCEKGYSCAAPSPDYLSNRCAYICDASGSGGAACDDVGGPGSEYTCVAINNFWQDDPVPNEWGACINCADFPDVTECE